MMVNRRAFLAAVFPGLAVSTSACLSGENPGKRASDTPPSGRAGNTTSSRSTDGGEEFTSPTSDAQALQELECEDDVFERVQSWVNDGVVWRTIREEGSPIFTLRISQKSIPLGDAVRITIRNVSEKARETGNLHKSNLSVLTENGWVEIRGWADGNPKPITDDVWEFRPGESHEWEFPLTEEGIIGMSYPNYQDSLTVCPSLQPGRYRFAIGAFPDRAEGLAIAFDVTESA